MHLHQGSDDVRDDGIRVAPTAESRRTLIPTSMLQPTVQQNNDHFGYFCSAE